MNLNISRVSFGNNYYISGRNIQRKQKNKKVPFKASSFNTARTLSYAFIAATMLSFASCSSNKKADSQEINTDIIQTEETTQIPQEVSAPQQAQSKKTYHYNPTDGPVRAEDYSWTETAFPDGSVEKDSMGYKIFITADGKRTSIHTEEDAEGNTTITTIYPDLTKKVHTDYKTNNPDDILYAETIYRSDGSIEERNFYNEFLVKDSTDIPQIKIETSRQKYNDKNILIMWDSNVTDTLRSDTLNEYDKNGRLIYDDIKQERYEYKGGSKIPYRSVSECDSCQRIKIYNSDGTIKEDFFKATDGTITQANDSFM